MRNPSGVTGVHSWCWGLAAVAVLLATQDVWSSPLGWLALGLLLAGDAIWVRSARPVAQPRPMPAAGYILMALFGLLWVAVGGILLFLLGWLGQGAGGGDVAFWALAALVLHAPAWLTGALLAESPRPRLVRVASLVGMLVGLPLLMLTLVRVVGAFPEAPEELLVPALPLSVLAVFGVVDLLSRRAARPQAT